MKKALILAYYFPPVAASGSLRPAGVSRYLNEHGFSPHIVTADPASIYPSVGLDSTLSTFVDDALPVDQISYRNTLKALLDFRERLRERLRDKLSFQADKIATPAAGEANTATNAVPSGDTVSLKDLLLDRLFLFPDHQKYWVQPVVAHVRNLPTDQRPDVLLATANPWSSLLAGQQIAKRMHIPWVADFRDPWWRNPKPQPNARLLPQIGRLEARVMEHATRVIANTGALANSFKTDYPQHAHKIDTVTNGFLEDLVPEQRTADVPQGLVEFCHFGSVYPLRSPKTLLKSLLTLVEDGVPQRLTVRLRFIGSWDVEDPECDELARRLEALNIITREPAVSREAAMQLMANASHLLILQQDFPLQIPAKLYEYISVGRPMLVVGGAGATEELVNEHRLGRCCPNDFAALKKLLSDVASGEVSIPQPDVATTASFNYRRIAESVAVTLEQALQDFADR